MQQTLNVQNCCLKTAVGYLKPTRCNGDQMPLEIQDIVEMTENDDESNGSTEFEDQTFTSDESDTE